MDIDQAIQSRRSVRKFTDKKIGKADIERIIKAGMYAPNACNIQGWKFIVIDNKENINKLVEMGAATFIKDVPMGVLVLYDNRTENIEYKDYIQSAAACIENMMLKAHSMGIGTCWVCHLPAKRTLRKYLNIPSAYDPIAFVAMGYPELSKTWDKKIKNVSEVLSYNKFEGSVEKKKFRGKRILRKIYYKLPFKKLTNKIANKFEKKFDL